jgi:hypothetical protein
MRKIEVANGFYSGIIFANNHFYVSYEKSHHVYVKVYDENFTFTGETHELASGGNDFRMVFGDNYFYLCFLDYLRKIDSDWNEVDSVYVATGLPSQASLDDFMLYYADGSIYYGVGVGNIPENTTGKKLDVPDDLYIREYDQNLELKNEIRLKDVGDVPSSGILLQNGNLTVVTSSKHWDDSDLIIVRYDENWNLIDSKTISVVPNAKEGASAWLLFENGIYFVVYSHITGDLYLPPIVPEGVELNYHYREDVMLKAFDSNWNLMNQTMVSDDIPASKFSHARGPYLVLVGDKIYVTYDSDEDNFGSYKVFVKEYDVIK